MKELAFLIWLEVLYQDMAQLVDDLPDTRAFFVQDQQAVIAQHPIIPDCPDLYF